VSAHGYVPPWSTPRLARALGLKPDTPPLDVVSRAVHELGVAQTAEALETPFAFWCDAGDDVVAARDGFGLAPLAWARGADGRIALSVDVAALAEGRHVDLGSAADYARFGWLPRVERTFFEGLSMVPHGHALVARGGFAERVELAPFSPARAAAVPGAPHEVVAGFWSRFADACEARAGGERVAVSLSGGLDSPLVAAALLERGVEVFGVTAAASVHDEELPLTRAVAAHLGIELEVLVVDEVGVFAGWDARRARAVEPREDWRPTRARLWALAEARGARALFSGTGADPLLVPPRDTARGVVRQRGLRGVVELALGRALHGVRPALRPRFDDDTSPPPIPAWASEELRRATEPAPDGETTGEAITRFGVRDGLRAGALYETTHGTWPRMVEATWDPARPGFVRYPFFAREVVEYVLSLPHVPWCAGKELLRAAGRGRLPEAALSRPKTPLAGPLPGGLDPAGRAAVLGDLEAAGRIVEIERLAHLADTEDLTALGEAWTALALANWWAERKGSDRETRE
jgi:asparagine synthetase B (glutamine-hydrolysing)